MIVGRFCRRLRLGLIDRRVDLFAGHHFRLVGLLLVERVGQLAALIFKGDLPLGIFLHHHLGAPKGARAGRGDELVDLAVVLQRQVLGHGAGRLEGEDALDHLAGEHGPMGVARVPRREAEAAIEVSHELRQIGIGPCDRGQPLQA